MADTSLGLAGTLNQNSTIVLVYLMGCSVTIESAPNDYLQPLCYNVGRCYAFCPHEKLEENWYDRLRSLTDGLRLLKENGIDPLSESTPPSST